MIWSLVVDSTVKLSQTISHPDEVSPGDDTFSIDPVYGDVIWDAPEIAGIYNVAIRIQEWRDVGGTLILVGEVVRDMQITVEVCTNQPPELEPIADTCVVAGSFLSLSGQRE